MKKIPTLLFGVALLTAIALPTFADELSCRIKTVDVDKGVVTVIEGKKDYIFTATSETKFLNVKDGPLVNGIKSGDLKEGRRVVVTFETKDGTTIFKSIKIRPAA